MVHQVEQSISRVGVIDKAVGILDAVEAGSRSHAELVSMTGYSRATVHRLATALEAHGMLRRTPEGKFGLGSRLLQFGQAALESWPLAALAQPALMELRDTTGESAQLYVVDGAERICIASLESPHGLRTIVETGARLPLDRGSAGRVLSGETPSRGYVVSIAEREAGVASVSAPVLANGGPGKGGLVVAAVGVSGPVERLGRRPGSQYGEAVMQAARQIEQNGGLA